MKYTSEQEFEEILRRGKEIREKKEKQVKHVLSAATVCLSVALLAVLSVFAGAKSTGAETAYGSFLLPMEAGGYMLTAVIAFALGVLVAVTIRQYRKKNGAGSSAENDADKNDAGTSAENDADKNDADQAK
jgi:hypothetical protein